MFSFGAGVDTTDYSGAVEAPELALKSLFVSEKIPTALRLALAKKGLNTVKKFALLGSDLDRYELKIKNIMKEELGADESTKELNVTLLGVVWQSCQKLMEYEIGQRVRLAEDPSKIPEIGMFELTDMRERFWTAHPDLLVNDDNEPHKKFIEKVNRDLTVHGVMLFYELVEVRVKKDKITATKGFSNRQKTC